MTNTELLQVRDALSAVCNRPDSAESYDAMMVGVQSALALLDADLALVVEPAIAFRHGCKFCGKFDCDCTTPQAAA